MHMVHDVNDNNPEHALLIISAIYFTVSLWTVSATASAYLAFYTILCLVIAFQFQHSQHVTGGVIVGTILLPLVFASFLYSSRDSNTQGIMFHFLLCCVTSIDVCINAITNDVFTNNLLFRITVLILQFLVLINTGMPTFVVLFALFTFYFTFQVLLRKPPLSSSFSLGEAVIIAQLVTTLFIRTLQLALYPHVRTFQFFL
jgi:hypothetical protein